MLQIMNVLDIVNSNLTEATESWTVCQKQIETMQQATADVDDNGFTLAICGDWSTDTAVQHIYDSAVLDTEQAENVVSKSSEPDNLKCLQRINSETMDSNCADKVLCPAADVEQLVDKSDKSSLKSAASSAKVPRNKHTVTDPKLQSHATSESKHVVGVQKNVASKGPKKAENTYVGKKVGSSSNVTSRQSSLSSRGSIDLSSSRSSAPLSSRVSNKPVDSTTRRLSVPKRTVKQPSVTGGSKQQSQTLQRKSSAVSTSSCPLLPDQKTTSESSLAAGDFSGDMPAVTSLRSSPPLTSSLGDSNDPSSISRVSSMSDASSLSASHGSTGAVSASVFQSPKLSKSTGEPQHLLL